MTGSDQDSAGDISLNLFLGDFSILELVLYLTLFSWHCLTEG